MTSNIRTNVIALAAAFAVAVSAAPVVPAAHAEDSIVPTSASDFCDAKWDQFAGWVRLAAEADRSGDTSSRDYYLAQARRAKNDASGCDWAGRAAVDPFAGGRVGDGLSIKQPDDSPSTDPVQTETTDPVQTESTDPVQTETPETVSSGADTGKKTKHKKHKKHKKHRKHKHQSKKR